MVFEESTRLKWEFFVRAAVFQWIARAFKWNYPIKWFLPIKPFDLCAFVICSGNSHSPLLLCAVHSKRCRENPKWCHFDGKFEIRSIESAANVHTHPHKHPELAPIAHTQTAKYCIKKEAIMKIDKNKRHFFVCARPNKLENEPNRNRYTI